MILVIAALAAVTIATVGMTISSAVDAYQHSEYVWFAALVTVTALNLFNIVRLSSLVIKMTKPRANFRQKTLRQKLKSKIRKLINTLKSHAKRLEKSKSNRQHKDLTLSKYTATKNQIEQQVFGRG